MLSKSKLVLVAALILGALYGTAASASAATATISPGGAVTGTGGAVQFTFNTARRTINCPASRFTATLTTSTTGTLPLTVSNDWNPLYNGGCTLTGGLMINGPCLISNLNTTRLTAGGITAISITNFGCSPTLSATCRVNFTDAAGASGGSVVGTFDNSTSRLSISTTSQVLAATGSTCATLPNDTSVTFTAAPFTIAPAQRITVS